MSAFGSLSLSALLEELRVVCDDTRLSYDEKEQAVRAALRLGESDAFRGDAAACALSAVRDARATHAELGALLTRVEPFSRLYADLWLSPCLSLLLAQPALCMREREGEGAGEGAAALQSMLRVALRLVPLRAVHADTLRSVSQWLCVSLSLDLATASAAAALLESLCEREREIDAQGERETESERERARDAVLGALSAVHAEHAHNTVVSLRALSLCATLCARDALCVSLSLRHGLLHALSQLCLSTAHDPLTQCNAMSLLADVARTAEGLQYLCCARNDVVQWLVTVACGHSERECERERNAIVGSEALRVLSALFAHAARESFQFVERLGSECVTSFLSATMGDLEDGDEASRMSALGVVSDFATISAVSLMLTVRFSEGRLLRAWLELMNTARVEQQAACLIALSKVFDQQDKLFLENERSAAGAEPRSVFSVPSVPITPEVFTVAHVSSLKQELLRSLGQVKGVSPSHLLLKSAKQPISSLRNASMHCMRAIACNTDSAWPLHALFNTTAALNDAALAQGEFWLFVRDRASEFGKDGKQYKFALIEALAAHPAKALLAEEIARLLDVMVKEGPFYMPPLMHEMETV